MSNAKNNRVHEPLFHLTKRESSVWWHAWLVRILAVAMAVVLLLGLVTSAFVVLFV